jgi:hypothetical protein
MMDIEPMSKEVEMKNGLCGIQPLPLGLDVTQRPLVRQIFHAPRRIAVEIGVRFLLKSIRSTYSALYLVQIQRLRAIRAGSRQKTAHTPHPAEMAEARE